MGRVIVDESRCKGCGICTAACPRDVIKLREIFNSFGYTPAYVTTVNNCTGCSLCAELCPDVAIAVFK